MKAMYIYNSVETNIDNIRRFKKAGIPMLHTSAPELKAYINACDYIYLDLKSLVKKDFIFVQMPFFADLNTRNVLKKLVVNYKNKEYTLVNKARTMADPDVLYESEIYAMHQAHKRMWAEHFREQDEERTLKALFNEAHIDHIDEDFFKEHAWEYDIVYNPARNFIEDAGDYIVLDFYEKLKKAAKAMPKRTYELIFEYDPKEVVHPAINTFCQLVRELAMPDKTEEDMVRITYYGNQEYLEDDIYYHSTYTDRGHGLRRMAKDPWEPELQECINDVILW